MREGTKTILSMQNRYKGPLEDFAMVVPVPQVLSEQSVKTLNKEIFDKIDTLTSPRLVEYWEQDPCLPQDDWIAAVPGEGVDASPEDVTVEAEFKVGEYEVVILSTTESTALADWLQTNNYSVPDNAAPYYEPYIQGGMYFFVARVDPDLVIYEDGQAILSPLRFDYDSQDFMLPTRLGMINSGGKQDLIVYTLGKNQRYELSNYPNIFIPTNIEVKDDVRENFGSFYQALYSKTLEDNPGAAVTEYSWAVSSCDPCPGPVTLDLNDIATLGGDVLETNGQSLDYVVTRLHLQYAKDEIGEDLVFREAPPVVGGREIYTEDSLEKGGTIRPDFVNNFQARYIIRHYWTTPVSCDDPVYLIWGGDPSSGNYPLLSSPSANTTGDEVIFSSSVSDEDLEAWLREAIPELNLDPEVQPVVRLRMPSSGCGVILNHSTLPFLFIVFISLWGVRRWQQDRRKPTHRT